MTLGRHFVEMAIENLGQLKGEDNTRYFVAKAKVQVTSTRNKSFAVTLSTKLINLKFLEKRSVLQQVFFYFTEVRGYGVSKTGAEIQRVHCLSRSSLQLLTCDFKIRVIACNPILLVHQHFSGHILV